MCESCLTSLTCRGNLTCAMTIASFRKEDATGCILFMDPRRNPGIIPYPQKPSSSEVQHERQYLDHSGGIKAWSQDPWPSLQSRVFVLQSIDLPLHNVCYCNANPPSLIALSPFQLWCVNKLPHWMRKILYQSNTLDGWDPAEILRSQTV